MRRLWPGTGRMTQISTASAVCIAVQGCWSMRTVDIQQYSQVKRGLSRWRCDCGLVCVFAAWFANCLLYSVLWFRCCVSIHSSVVAMICPTKVDQSANGMRTTWGAKRGFSVRRTVVGIAGLCEQSPSWRQRAFHESVVVMVKFGEKR